ncbi:unnamed protein product, partial [Ectocarpus fasciculatus]
NLHALQGFKSGNTGGLKGLLRFGNKLTGGPAEGEGLDSWKARIRGDIDHQEEDDDVPAFESVPSSRVSFMGRWQAQTGEDDEIKQDASVPLSTPNQRQEEAEVDRSFRAQLSSSAGLDSLIRENPEALQDIQRVMEAHVAGSFHADDELSSMEGRRKLGTLVTMSTALGEVAV